MKRSLLTLALATVVSGVGCSSPVCGPGTKQHQKSNGDIECLPVDLQPAGIACDVDGGATIVAGKCVSAITCGPNTKLENGECVGTGGMGGSHVPPACPTPDASHICINGVVRHLVDGSFLAPGETVRVAVYNPLAFLSNPTTTPLAEMTTDDTYVFPNVGNPAGLIAVAISDVTGTTPQVLQITGSGGITTNGKSYQIDTYATPHSLVTTWSSQAGVDYDAMGAYVTKYYLDTGPDPTKLTATETMPAAGVQVVEDTMVATRAKYFGADLMTVDKTLTATSAIGVGILTGTGSGQPPTFSGKGNTPGDKWEHHPGDSTGHVVFVDRFHPCKTDGSGNCTN